MPTNGHLAAMLAVRLNLADAKVPTYVFVLSLVSTDLTKT